MRLFNIWQKVGNLDHHGLFPLAQDNHILLCFYNSGKLTNNIMWWYSFYLPLTEILYLKSIMFPQTRHRNIKWNVTDLLYPTPELYTQCPEVTYVHFALFFLELFCVCIHKYTAITTDISVYVSQIKQLSKHFTNKFKMLCKLILYNFTILYFLYTFWIIYCGHRRARGVRV